MPTRKKFKAKAKDRKVVASSVSVQEVVSNSSSDSSPPNDFKDLSQCRRSEIQGQLSKAKNLLKNQNYDGASQTFLQGLHDLKPVELEICGTNFAYGHALSLLKMSLQLGQVLSVAHIEQALRVLSMTIKEDVVSLIDRKACKLFMFLLVRHMKLSCFCTDFLELDIVKACLDTVMHCGDSILQEQSGDAGSNDLPPMTPKEVTHCTALIDEAKEIFLECVANVQAQVPSDDLDDISEVIRNLDIHDLNSMDDGQWMTDRALQTGISLFLPCTLESGFTTVKLDP